MQSFFAEYIVPGTGIEPQTISVLLLKKSIKLGYKNEEGHPQVEEWMLNELSSQYKMGSNETSVILAGKGKQLTSEGDALHKAIIAVKEYNALPRHKKILTPVFYKQFTAALVMLLLLAGGYFLLAPWLSGLLAKKLPRKYEISLGETVYKSLMKTYTIDEQKTKLAGNFLAELNFQSDYPVQVTVVNSKQVNAFALPGGHIVIYSALLGKMKDHSELAALLAHEFTHVNNRHSTRSIFRSLGSKAFLSLLFGRTGMLTTLVVDNADFLKSLKYSRSLEKEADIEGLKLLKEKQVDGRGFVWLMQHLGEASKDVLPEMITSHPNIEKRIKYLQASEHFVPRDSAVNKNLPAIFSQLMQ